MKCRVSSKTMLVVVDPSKLCQMSQILLCYVSQILQNCVRCISFKTLLVAKDSLELCYVSQSLQKFTRCRRTSKIGLDRSCRPSKIVSSAVAPPKQTGQCLKSSKNLFDSVDTPKEWSTSILLKKYQASQIFQNFYIQYLKFFEDLFCVLNLKLCPVSSCIRCCRSYKAVSELVNSPSQSLYKPEQKSRRFSSFVLGFRNLAKLSDVVDSSELCWVS